MNHSALSGIEIGGFASYATWPVGVPGGTSTTAGGAGAGSVVTDRKAVTKYGGELHGWFGSDALPVHAVVTLLQGRDDKALVPGGVRDGVFNGGFLEVIANPSLPFVLFGRYDFVRNRDQAVPARPRDFNDQTAYSLGVKHTFEFTTRAEYALVVNYSLSQTKQGAPDGSDLTRHSLWTGITFAF
jgi:hypothetical protein